MTFGTCRYCGQVVNLDYEEETQAEADIAASEKCECYDARHERNLRKQITAAQNRIRKIFGDDAAKLGFAPIAAEEPLQLLNAIAEQTARGFITSATINVRGLCKAKITMTTKEKIKDAIDKTILNTGKINFPYIDKVIKTNTAGTYQKPLSTVSYGKKTAFHNYNQSGFDYDKISEALRAKQTREK